MRVIILYESFFGNTRDIAFEIAKGIGRAHSISIEKITETQDSSIKDADLLIVGSATRGFTSSPATKQFLNNLENGSLRDKLVASFDTRIALDTIKNRTLRIMVDKGGYAARPINKRLLRKGGKQIADPEGFLVMGEKGPLKDGELARAFRWGTEIAKQI